MKKSKKELPKVEPVKIKPLFGMKPGLWLSIAYLLAILLLFFLIGFLPDIIRDVVALDDRREGAFSKYETCRIYG